MEAAAASLVGTSHQHQLCPHHPPHSAVSIARGAASKQQERRSVSKVTHALRQLDSDHHRSHSLVALAAASQARTQPASSQLPA